jgi:hypothetical protein
MEFNPVTPKVGRRCFNRRSVDVLFSGHLFSHLVVHMHSRTKGGMDPFSMGGGQPHPCTGFLVCRKTVEIRRHAFYFYFAKNHVSEAKTLHQ